MLAHPSWERDPGRSYERLEFLGDAVLKLVVARELFDRHPAATEGELTLMCQRVVSREVCAETAEAAGLPERLAAAAPRARRETMRDLAARTSVRSAVVAALIGAAWLDLGPDAAAEAVRDAFGAAMDRAPSAMRDPKTALQEAAARRREGVAYELVGQEGPPHAPTFRSRALVGGRPMGEGEGGSKQASEQAAAARALQALDVSGAASC